MPRYHFNIQDGESIPDPDGTILANIREAKTEAVRLSGRLLSEDPAKFWNGEQWSLEVCDDTGLVLFSLDFHATMAPALKGS